MSAKVRKASERRVKLRWATADEILSWSGGEVDSPDSLNYSTLRPERRGLLAERVFGPLTVAVEADDRWKTFGHVTMPVAMKHPWSGAALTVLPVLPPGARRMQKIGDAYALHDLSELYRRIINEAAVLKRMVELGAPKQVVDEKKHDLELAVRRLFDNARIADSLTYASGRPTRALADALLDETSFERWSTILRGCAVVAEEGAA